MRIWDLLLFPMNWDPGDERCLHPPLSRFGPGTRRALTADRYRAIVAAGLTPSAEDRAKLPDIGHSETAWLSVSA